jgi:hypothetical protein
LVDHGIEIGPKLASVDAGSAPDGIGYRRPRDKPTRLNRP